MKFTTTSGHTIDGETAKIIEAEAERLANEMKKNSLFLDREKMKQDVKNPGAIDRLKRAYGAIELERPYLLKALNDAYADLGSTQSKNEKLIEKIATLEAHKIHEEAQLKAINNTIVEIITRRKANATV